MSQGNVQPHVTLAIANPSFGNEKSLDQKADLGVYHRIGPTVSYQQ